MKIAMFRTEDGQTLFLSGGLSGQAEEPLHSSRRGRWEQTVRNLHAATFRAGRRVGPTGQRLRDWLNRQVSADETLLLSLRQAARIRLEHPADLDSQTARGLWQDYLQARQAHHLRRLALNVILCPLTILLAPIPGPNLVGYWFVYRACCHAWILLGARRALGPGLGIEPQPSLGLDAPLSGSQIERLAQAAGRHGGRSFETVLQQLLVDRAIAAGPERTTVAPPVVRPVLAPRPAPAPEPAHGPVRRAVNMIPNLLTIARIALAVAFPLAAGDQRVLIFLLAAATEFLDGALSRWLHATTLTGRILDPIADKLFVLSVLGTLWWQGPLAGWMILLIAARDLLVVAGIFWVLAWEGTSGIHRMPPRLPGKAATTAQFLFLLLTISQGSVHPWMFAVTAVLSVIAGVDYLRRYR